VYYDPDLRLSPVLFGAIRRAFSSSHSPQQGEEGINDDRYDVDNDPIIYAADPRQADDELDESMAQDSSTSEDVRRQPWVIEDGCFATCQNFGINMPALYVHLKERTLAASDGDGGEESLVKKYTVGKEIDAMYTRGADTGWGHVFYFQSGATVFWGVPESLRPALLSNATRFGLQKQAGNQRVKTWSDDDLFEHDFECKVVPGARTKFKDDLIVLDAWENIYEMLAISYGLAQSTQLSMFERTVQDLIDKTSDLPSGIVTDSVMYRKLPLNQIRRLTAEMLDARYNINIRSDILDTPYFLWENSDLMSIYEQTIREVQLQKRHNLVNTRTEIIKETLELLNNERQNHIGHNLERYIIYLITLEILLELLPMVRGWLFS